MSADPQWNDQWRNADKISPCNGELCLIKTKKGYRLGKQHYGEWYNYLRPNSNEKAKIISWKYLDPYELESIINEHFKKEIK